MEQNDTEQHASQVERGYLEGIWERKMCKRSSNVQELAERGARSFCYLWSSLEKSG